MLRFSLASDLGMIAILAVVGLTGCSRHYEIDCDVSSTETEAHWNITGECAVRCWYDKDTQKFSCTELEDAERLLNDQTECKAFLEGTGYSVIGPNCACNVDVTVNDRVTIGCL